MSSSSSAHGVPHARTPAGSCVTGGRDHQDWPHEPAAAAGVDVAALVAELNELRLLVGERTAP